MIDLHSHTTRSDGTLEPGLLVLLAAERGLEALAVTDHDTTVGLAEARETGERVGVEVIDGCEVSTRIPEGNVHLLAYGFDPEDPRLQALLAGVRQDRVRRNRAILDRFRTLGIKLTVDEVARHARGVIVARPHFAQALLERGVIAQLHEAYTRYLSDDGPAYVPAETVHPAKAIAVVKAAGGVTSVAHPRQLRLGGFDAHAACLSGLVDAGLDGLEVEHPSHRPADRALFRALCEHFDLVPTGGSDFHGANKPRIALGHGDGTIHVPYETWERLRARRRP
ncbi:MAG: PHP domain-containing protein [Planctomycetota bacterium]